MNRQDVLALIENARKSNKKVDLHNADLREIDLREIDLRCADLQGAKLWGANLQGADLRRADLRESSLFGANLLDANLHNAVLWGANWNGLTIDNLPSGSLMLIPTPNGWYLKVGCWGGTPDALRAIATSDDEMDWPDADKEEIPRRREYLLAALALVDLHIADHQMVVPDLAARWLKDKVTA